MEIKEAKAYLEKEVCEALLPLKEKNIVIVGLQSKVVDATSEEGEFDLILGYVVRVQFEGAEFKIVV